MSEIRDIAAAAHNEAFELVVEGEQSDALKGLELAATSLNLWRRVGTPKNEAIGLWLYARALHKAGSTSLAIEASNQCVTIAKTLDIDWMLASALEGLARATGDPAILKQAQAAIEEIKDAEDRQLIKGQIADLL